MDITIKPVCGDYPGVEIHWSGRCVALVEQTPDGVKQVNVWATNDDEPTNQIKLEGLR